MRNEHSSRMASVARFAVVCFVAFASSCSALGAVAHYIDNTASGLNDGSSWANAWQHFYSVNWASVAPGDVVYISGGTVSQTYGGFLKPTVSGTAGNPITITIDNVAGKNGIVIFDGADGPDGFSYIDFSGKHDIVLDGWVGGTRHFAPINLYDIVERTHGNKVFADGSTRVTVRGCAFTNVNQCVSLVAANGFIVENNVGRDVRGDAAVRAVNSPDLGFNSHFVRYNDFELAYTNSFPYLGPDGIQGSHGLTVQYNRITTKKVNYITSTQHPDYTQIIGNHIIISGNDFVNIGDSGNDFDWWVNPTPHDIWIFNNVYHIVTATDPLPEYIRWYATAGSSITSISNFKIFNNTFVDDSTWANILCAAPAGWGASGNPTISGFDIVNNIWVNGTGYEIANNPDLSIHPIGFTNNVYAPGFTVNYRGTNYTSITVSAIEPTRISGVPTFVGYTPFAATNDFHLAPSDTVAQNAGMNLYALTQVDHDGNPRPSTGVWDIGAYQHQTTNAPPNTPTNVTPIAGATGVAVLATLTGSAYSDPGSLPHAATQFIVYANDGVTPLWTSPTLGAVITTTTGALPYATTCKWTVRYQSNVGLWSAWSTQTDFTTLSNPNPQTTLEAVTAHIGSIVFP